MPVALVRPQAPAASPARQRLGEAIAAVAQVEAERDRRQLPVSRLQAELDRAEAELARAESAHAAIDGLEVDDLTRWARAGGDRQAPRDRVPAQAAIDAERRALAAVKGATVDAERALGEAQAAVLDVSARLRSAVIVVLVEDHTVAVERLRQAREAALAAEATAVGLGHFLASHGRALLDAGASQDAWRPWLANVERLHEAIGALAARNLTVDEIEHAAGRWGTFAQRLTGDAAAVQE